jgi:Family of unknown function (DUF6353)
MRLLSETMVRGLGKHALTLRKTSPTIFFVGGVIGMIGSTVLACRATLKLEETLDENKKKVQAVQEFQNEKYSQADREQDTAILYIRSAIAVAKLYAPAVLLGSASIGMLTQSHNILVKRNAALAAAYTALDKGFREYRARVVDKYGEDEDLELRYGSEKVTIKDPETGKNKTVSRVGPDGASIYARFFDQYNPNWSKDPEINKLFLRSQQSFLNNLLHARGHVFLNEVYDSLGFDHSEAGSVVGWKLHNGGDDFIDFGVFHAEVPDHVRHFVNGREGSVLLDFNVDGLIYNKIEPPKERLSWQRSS